jgi:hypothetical protein
MTSTPTAMRQPGINKQPFPSAGRVSIMFIFLLYSCNIIVNAKIIKSNKIIQSNHAGTQAIRIFL